MLKKLVKTNEFRKMREVQVDLAKQFIHICNENNIKCYAIYGTLLGAIRHKGFIPWDDDIDLAVWREDVDKICKLISERSINSYQIVTLEETQDFYCGVMKFQDSSTTNIDMRFFSERGSYGIGIDIAVIDYTFSFPYFRTLKNWLLHKIYLLLYYKQYGEECFVFMKFKYVRKKAYNIISKCFKRKKILKAMYRIQRWHGFTNKFCSLYTYNQHDLFRSSWFEEGTSSEFEKILITIPVKYEKILQAIFGKDYMKFPKEAEQIPKHLYMHYLNPYIPYKDSLLRITHFLNASNRITVLWGAGNMCDHYFRLFGKKYPPQLIVDNDFNKWDKEKNGVRICTPDIIINYKIEEIHIIICNIYITEIVSQIRSMGDYFFTIYSESYIDKINGKKCYEYPHDVF